MKKLITQLAVLFLFIIQTAYPFGAQLWMINITPLLSYLVATSFVLPLNQSAVIFFIIILLYYLTNSSLLLPSIILFSIIFLVTKYIQRHHTSKLLSYSYLFLLFFAYHIILNLVYYFQNSIDWHEILGYFLQYSLIEIFINWVLTLVFISVLQLIFDKHKPGLDLE